MMVDPALGGEAYGYLTTTGRISGKPHEIEIWFALEGSTAYLMNGNSRYTAGKADWVRNLRKQPSVSFRIAGQTFAATARLVTDSEEDALVRRLLLAKYATAGNPLEDWGRIAVPVAIELEA